MWRKNNGSQADFNVWRANFGVTLGSGTSTSFGSSGASVPEPAGIVLLALGAAFGGIFGRRRRHLI